jgi:hypothetical protein
VRLALKFGKSANMTKNLFFEKIQKGIKNVEFHADVKSVKKFLKNAQKS